MNWLSVLPITAVVAVVVFIIKEVLEYFRRRGADKRKIAALIALLARECELNYWTIKSLRRIVAEISTEESPNPQFRLTIERKSSGRPYAKVVSEDGKIESHSGIPKVHRELMSKFLLDIATLDKKLFEVMEPAYDALADLEHVRETLVNIDDEVGLIPRDDFLSGFAGYAVVELKDAEVALGALYKYCTNKPLTQHRLR